MGKSVVLRAEAVSGGWTGGPVTTLETVEQIRKVGYGGNLPVLKSYTFGRMVRGAAWRTLCSSLKCQSMLSTNVLEAWYMKAVDAFCPRAVRRLSASLFQSFSDLLRFVRRRGSPDTAAVDKKTRDSSWGPACANGEARRPLQPFTAGGPQSFQPWRVDAIGDAIWWMA